MISDNPERIAPALTPGPDGAVGVLAAIMAVRGELLAGVGTDSTNDHFRFNYRSADAVVNAIARPMHDAGLMLVPSVQLGERHHFEAGRSADSLLAYHVTYSLFHTDGSSLTGGVVSQAQGNTAYASGAAMSYAIKYFCSQVFGIPFHDARMDLESDEHTADVEEKASPRLDDWQRRGWTDQRQHDEARTRLMRFMKSKKTAADGKAPESDEAVELAQIRTWLKHIEVIGPSGHVPKLVTAEQMTQVGGKYFADDPFGDDEPNESADPEAGQQQLRGAVLACLKSNVDPGEPDDPATETVNLGVIGQYLDGAEVHYGSPENLLAEVMTLTIDEKTDPLFYRTEDELPVFGLRPGH